MLHKTNFNHGVPAGTKAKYVQKVHKEEVLSVFFA